MSKQLEESSGSRPYLNDHIIDDIFQRLPTKDAVRASVVSKQWETVFLETTLKVLDFDEAHGNNQHSKFVIFVKNTLTRCLKQKQALDKFGLRMTSYLTRDATMVTESLRLSFERSVKEVDISLRHLNWSPLRFCSLEEWHDLRSREWRSWEWRRRGGLYYCFSRTSFVNAKLLTSMNLEYVRICNIQSSNAVRRRLLPSLKNMSFKHVDFKVDAFSSLIEECPSVEHVSLISCDLHFNVRVSSSSLKSLEVKDCKVEFLLVCCVNLENVTILFPRHLSQMAFEQCFNLKQMNIRASCMDIFRLRGCHNVEEVTIDAPKLHAFWFRGNLKCKFSLKVPRLGVVEIRLQNLWDEESSSFNKPWKHFGKLKDLLEELSSCRKYVTLTVDDFKDLIFPKNFRETFSKSTIFPNVEVVHFGAAHVTPTTPIDMERLMQSLRWMAPSAKDIYQLQYKADSDMYVDPPYV